MPIQRSVSRRTRLMLGVVASLLSAQQARAQWSQVYEQFYYPDRTNWVFRTFYPAADRQFNAFDYGHAILYETLWAKPDAPASVLEEGQYNYLTRDLLLRPPRVPLEERAIEPLYARLAPEAKMMFDWAHVLHRQAYDILADERLTDAGKDAKMAVLLRYYRTRRDLAFSATPKNMSLMQEQPYSLAFREKYPKFNGLIWAYHWLQIGLYEPLVKSATTDARQAGIAAALARFKQMLLDPPRTLPYQMPMTAAVAPAFSERYRTFAIIFDNLHSMHDVISDILANPSVPRDRKRAEILLAAQRFRDDTTAAMSVEGWKRMAMMMGLQNMGGSPVEFLPALPSPTVARGAVMRHDKDGNMIGGEHAGHDMADMPGMAPRKDSVFAKLQERGKAVMGVDQYTSQHVFEDLPEGGRIVLVRDPADTAGTQLIRAHLRKIADAFERGDFALPGQVHDREVPGTRVMAAKRDAIHYMFEERLGGGAVIIHAADTDTIRAVHAFLDFQRREHRAPGQESP